MWSSHGSDRDLMLRCIIKGKRQVHNVSRGQAQSQKGSRASTLSHIWGQRSGTMVYPRQDSVSLRSEAVDKRSDGKEEGTLVSRGQAQGQIRIRFQNRSSQGYWFQKSGTRLERSQRLDWGHMLKGTEMTVLSEVPGQGQRSKCDPNSDKITQE